MGNKISSIRLSGTTYPIEDSGATKVVEITQASYDSLPSSAKTANIMYIITDAQAVDISGKQDISGMTAYTEVSAFTAHSGDSAIHVTTAQTAAWDAKSDFSGSYNDLTDKPTIPTSASQLTNDAGYATSGYVDSVVSGKADSSAVTQEITAAVSGKVDSSSVVSSVTSASTDSEIPTAKAVYSKTSGAVTNIIDDWSGNTLRLTLFKNGGTPADVNLLSLGNGLTRTGSVISVTGGGATVSSAITSGDTNAVAGGAVYDKFDEVEQVTARALNGLAEADEVAARALNDLNDRLDEKADTSAVTQEISAAVSGKTDTSAFTAHSGDTSIHHTSTSAVTSGSTSVITSGGVYEQMGGLKLVKLTQSAYDALSPSYDSNTLYVIVN